MGNGLEDFIKAGSPWLWGMMELTVSTLERFEIQLSFENGPEGFLDYSEDAQVIFSLTKEPI